MERRFAGRRLDMSGRGGVHRLGDGVYRLGDDLFRLDDISRLAGDVLRLGDGVYRLGDGVIGLGDGVIGLGDGLFSPALLEGGFGDLLVAGGARGLGMARTLAAAAAPFAGGLVFVLPMGARLFLKQRLHFAQHLG